MDIHYKPDALHPDYKTVRLEDKLGEDMPDQKRRIDDKLPGQPLDWSDAQAEQQTGDLADDRALFDAAIDKAYPVPDSPHTSVMQRANDSRAAFTRGWQDRAAIAVYLARQSQAAQPSIEDIYVAGFMASSEGFNAEYGCSDPWASEWFVKGMREYLAAHLAGQPQATKVQAECEWPTCECVLDLDNCKASKAAQAVDTRDAALARMERAEWCAVFSAMRDARAALCKGGIQHTWLDGAIALAESRVKQQGDYAATPAGQATKVQAVPEEWRDFLEMWTHDGALQSFSSREKFRKAARELIDAAPTAQEVTQQAAPEAQTNDDEGEFEEPDHGETVLRVQEALGITRTGWISPDVILHRIEMLKRTPVTQQAAKAETAEQAEGEQANVLPPTRGTDSQHDAGFNTLLGEIMNLPCKLADSEFASRTDRLNYKLGHRDARYAAIDLVAEFARRFRAQGENTNTESSDLAPTTSTVSALDNPAETKSAIVSDPAKVRAAIKAACQDGRIRDARRDLGEIDQHLAKSSAAPAVLLAAKRLCIFISGTERAEGTQAAPDEIRALRTTSPNKGEAA